METELAERLPLRQVREMLAAPCPRSMGSKKKTSWFRFWLAYLDNHAEMLPFYEAETAAIHRRDPDGARAACDERSEVMARITLGELVRRGVFKPTGAGIAF